MAQLDFFKPAPRPWNIGRIVGPKPPFKPKHVWGSANSFEPPSELGTWRSSIARSTPSSADAT